MCYVLLVDMQCKVDFSCDADLSNSGSVYEEAQVDAIARVWYRKKCRKKIKQPKTSVVLLGSVRTVSR